jgi:hypothetical protein
MRYRKRPVVIEAVQWFKNGDHPDDGTERFPPKSVPPNPFVDVPSDADGSASDPRYTGEFAGELYEGKVVRYFRRPDVPGDTGCRQCGRTMDVHGWIDTPEGGHIVCPGDWVITGIQGEHYPCKPDIFAETYDAVEES